MITISIQPMSKEIIPEISANYDFYNQLLKERKSVFESVISIVNVGNNHNTLEESIPVVHSSYQGPMLLIVNVKKNDSNFFQFKLKCRDICPTPFFRFDSDGDTHRNFIAGLTLPEQQIPTPHFHYYNQDGLNIAYKTPPLLEEDQKKALQDISLCLAHFFQESNINTELEDFCEVKILPQLLPLVIPVNDPHANIIFP